MAASDNSVTLVGNVTDDPELRFTPSGAAVANFTVAVNRRFKNQSGEWEDRLDGFFRCSCWREMAENAAESLTKGSRVIVVGRLQQRKWETQDGQTRSDIEVQVDELGPSLRWATARPQKSQRSGAQQGGWSTPPPQAEAPQAAGAGPDWSEGAAPAPVGGAPDEEASF